MKNTLVIFVASALIAGWSARCAAEDSKMETEQAVAELVRGNNAFAIDLYARIGKEEGNRFISPFSISCALAMTKAGARDETADQIDKALHFTLPAAELHPAFHRLIDELNQQNGPAAGAKPARPFELFIANALWTQSGERILPDFQKLIESNYGGALYPVDFRGAAAAARQYINHWVEEQTKGKIQDLLKPQNVTAQTVLILTNAIYFKATWASPFSPQLTKPDDFHASPGEKVRVDMMHHSGRFHYAEDAATQTLELPYQGGSLAMVIVLPKAKDGLSAARGIAFSPQAGGHAEVAVIAARRSQPSKIQAHGRMRAARYAQSRSACPWLSIPPKQTSAA